MKVLIVASGEDARDGYQEALRALAVPFDAAADFGQALQLAIKNRYNGILIDMLTLVRSSKEEKVIAYDCLNLYPSLRVKWDSRKGQMNLGLLEQSFTSDTEASLRYFFEQKCRAFPARSLRQHQRNILCLNVLLATTEECPEEACLKSFTVNVSRGGVFVHTVQSFRPGEIVWLRFLELSDPAPVRARVSWHVPWGTARCIPGVGLAFESLSESQAQEITHFAKG